MLTWMRAMIRPAPLGMLVAALATPAAPAQVPDETALPASTLAVIKIKDTSELRDKLGRSQLGQLLADPAMDDFKADIAGKLEDFNDEMKSRIGVTIEELLRTPQGPAWIAVTRREDAIPIGVLLVADAGENADQMQEIMTKGTEQLRQEAEGDVSTEDFQDLTLHVIQPPQDDSPPLVWTNDGGVYFISMGGEALKELLANRDGREDSLATSETYQAVGEKLGGDALITWYVDAAEILGLVTQVAADQGQDPGQIGAILQVLGINQIKAFAGTIDFVQGDYDTVSEAYVYAPGRRTGLLSIFPMPPVSPEPEPWVPGDVARYSSLSWDLDEAFTAVQDLVNQFLPNALDQVERGLEGPGGETIRFQQDIFGPLGDRITTIADFNEEGEEISPEDQRALFAVALEDPEAMRNTINKVIAIAGAQPQKREFQGTTIYDIELPEMPAAPGAPQIDLEGTVSFAIAKDYLFVTGNAPLLERILRGGGSSLAENAAFRGIAEQYPGRVSSFQFNRPDQQARVAYNLVKSGQLEQAIEMANTAGADADLPDLNEFINPDVLPEFSVFAKYLTEGGGYWVMDDSGLTITQFTLRKSNP